MRSELTSTPIDMDALAKLALAAKAELEAPISEHATCIVYPDLADFYDMATPDVILALVDTIHKVAELTALHTGGELTPYSRPNVVPTSDLRKLLEGWKTCFPSL